MSCIGCARHIAVKRDQARQIDELRSQIARMEMREESRPLTGQRIDHARIDELEAENARLRGKIGSQASVIAALQTNGTLRAVTGEAKHMRARKLMAEHRIGSLEKQLQEKDQKIYALYKELLVARKQVAA